jgi:cytochrome c oxidase cbb3-type subunit I/II
MIWAMRKLGVPYPEGYEDQANKDLETQAAMISLNLKADKIKSSDHKEIIALIAYLQRLGKDIKAAPKAQLASNEGDKVMGN